MPVVTAAYTNFPSYRRSFETTACHAVSVVIAGTVIASVSRVYVVFGNVSFTKSLIPVYDANWISMVCELSVAFT